ncbi:hypothetical protein QBC35DRAFT_516140 [Podospora australis]|uniref:Gamma-glutamylcyclotransferase AIG2-like domain-containing protein n=1 Tax=Podospora australis TaxID=1536484 RepID=A0AAN6WS84_9PEZI|nr:hypothetical protein QBC35DRAFT_516140 [Podospora australis]
MSLSYLEEPESRTQQFTGCPSPHEVDLNTIQRWQKLFGYSYPEAVQKVERHRTDLLGGRRTYVADAHWELVRQGKEAQGYDKEAYEHLCHVGLPAQTKTQSSTTPSGGTPRRQTKQYLLKLEGPIADTKTLKQAAGCSDELPPIIAGTDDSGQPAKFCIVDATAKQSILSWLLDNNNSKFQFQPTFVRYAIAEKVLSSTSKYPSLGIDTTMPQHRLCCCSRPPSPAQDQYPVWYFFYGTLADPKVLNRLIYSPHDPMETIIPCCPYRPARVAGGILTTWGDKDKALTKEQEESLRLYETDRYEVVRCDIEMLDEEEEDIVVKGLTFRFIQER